jgi:prolipoprotein diacylglyceryltransferase
MIPYFDLPPLWLGPLDVQLFGLLWLFGWLVGTGVTVVRAEKEQRRLWVAMGPVAVGVPLAALASHAAQAAPAWTGTGVPRGLELPWFLAYAVPFAVVWFAALDPTRLWASLDGFALGMTALRAVGRFGSFLVHDDLGAPTLFPLAVQGVCPDYPHSPLIACHDLGLYDVIACSVWLYALGQLRERGAGPGIAAGASLTALGVWRVLTGLLRPAWPFSGGWLDPTLIVLGTLTLWAAAVAREPR